MLKRRHFIATSAFAAAGLAAPNLIGLGRAQAQAIDVLKLFVPAAPGGGWDQTARSLESVLRATGAIGAAQVTNVAGAGGVVGLPQFLNQWKGQSNSLMVAGMVMVGSILTAKSPLKMTDTVPIARLTGEFEALVVPAASPFKDAKDFAAALKADPAKVPIAGGSAGGTDHILAGLIAKSVGVPATKVGYVAFSGGGQALAALLGNQVAAGISGYAEFAEQIKAGKLRLLAMSSDKRVPGIDAPTLKEQGIDVELANWRGVFAPPGVSDAQRAAMSALIEKMAASPQWKEECEKRDWIQITMMGDAYKAYIESEFARIGDILKDLGLA